MEVYDMNKIKYAVLVAVCSTGMANAFGFFGIDFGMPPVVHTGYYVEPAPVYCPPVRHIESVRYVQPVRECRVVERVSCGHDHHHGRYYRRHHHFRPRPHMSFGFAKPHFSFGFNF